MQEELASALSKKLLEVGIEGKVSNLEPLTEELLKRFGNLKFLTLNNLQR